MSAVLESVGISSAALCREVGCTYRQIDYWTRQGFVSPSIRDCSGSGTQRRWSATDVNVVKVLHRFSDASYSFRHRISAELNSISDQLDDGWLMIAEDGALMVADDPAQIPELLRLSGGICHIVPLSDEVAAA